MESIFAVKTCAVLNKHTIGVPIHVMKNFCGWGVGRGLPVFSVTFYVNVVIFTPIQFSGLHVDVRNVNGTMYSMKTLLFYNNL